MRESKPSKTKASFVSILLISALVIGAVFFFSSSSRQRAMKDFQSEYGGGLNRIVNIYALDGTIIASHKGRIDIEDRENYILFDLDGKRYVYYNAIIEVVEQ